MYQRERSAGEHRFLPPASAVSRKMQTADLGGDGYNTGYHVPKPREGRHSRTAASLMRVTDPEMDDEYGEVAVDGTCRPGTARARSASGVRFGAGSRAHHSSGKERLRPGTPWVKRPGTGRYRAHTDSEDEAATASSDDDEQPSRGDTPRSVRISTQTSIIDDDGSSSSGGSSSSLPARTGGQYKRSSLSSAATAKAVPEDFADSWRPGSGYPRPRSSFHEREATFSKSVMHGQLHRDFPEKPPDLRYHQGLPGRKRYIIHGSHGYWFHHG